MLTAAPAAFIGRSSLALSGRSPFLVLLALVIGLVAAPQARRANALCVNLNGSGGCYTSIAAAVSAAVDGDTVQIAAGIYQESAILVDKAITITGAGVDQTIVDGTSTHADGVAVFQFGVPTSWPAREATIAQLTITGGYRGVHAGGCANDITLDHVRITGNGPGSGAGYFNNCSTVRLYASRIDHNSATRADFAGCDWGWGGTGGGIASLCGGGANVIRQSTIDHNTASFIGGGLAINDTTSLIENSTISDNAADSMHMDGTVPLVFGGGGIWISGSPQVTIRYSTVADNAAPNGAGGGIHGGLIDPTGSRFVSLEGSIVSGNTALAMSTDLGRPAPGLSTANCGGWFDNGVTSLGGNVIGDASCQIAGPGDAIGTDALLGALADNGGPTPTRALQPGSAGIDNAPSCGVTGSTANTATLLGFSELVTVDQRGTARPSGTACDSGAFEAVVTVGDTVPPTIAPHADVTAEATGRAGARVTYTAPATQDNVDGAGVATCAPASGALFPVGATSVACSASDAAGNHATSTFTVHVVDTTAPVFEAYSNIVANQIGRGLRTELRVSYRAPRATDAVSGTIAGTCTPASNSLFPIGFTTVHCVATDGAGNAASMSFKIKVNGDVTPPRAVFGGNRKQDKGGPPPHEATSPAGAVVVIPNFFVDDFDPNPVMTCTPASRSIFPIGTTTVQCRAVDASGNVSDWVLFQVVVADTIDPTIAIDAPAKGAHALNSTEIVSFSCADTGSGIKTCKASLTTPNGRTQPIVNGAPLLFATVGQYSLTVKAVDAAGLKATKTINMRVTR